MKQLFICLFLSIAFFACKDDDATGDPIMVGAPQTNFTIEKAEYLIGERVFFTNVSQATASEIKEYFWHFGFNGAGNYSHDENPSITYSKAGVYTVKLTATSVTGAYSTCVKEITVLPANEAPSADFSYLPRAIQINQDVRFTDISTDNDGEVTAWSWDFGNGTTSAEQNPTTRYASAGLYMVKLTVTDNRGATNYKQTSVRVLDKAPEDKLTILWEVEFEANSTLRSVSPAVGDNGDVYITSNNRKLYAVTPSGSIRWTFDMSKDGATGNQESSPMVDPDGTIYCGVGQGSSSTPAFLYAINPDGSMKWKYSLGAGARIAYTSPVLYSDGNILIGNRGSGGAVRLVNRNNGTVVWSLSPSGGVGGCIAAAKNGYSYSGSTGTNGIAVINDAPKVTSYMGKTANGSCIAIDKNGNVYLALQNGSGASTGIVMCYDYKGEKQWEYETTNSIDQGGAALGEDGTIYVGTKGTPSELLALSKSGSKLWSYSNASPISAVPAVDNKGNIHYCDEGGNYVVLDNAGNLKYTQNIGSKAWSSPAISDYGVIYVALQDGTACKLVAIDTGIQGPAASDWAQRGQNPRKNFRQK